MEKKRKLITILAILLLQTQVPKLFAQEIYLSDSINFIYGIKDPMGKIVPNISFSFVEDQFHEELFAVGNYFPSPHFEYPDDSIILFGFINRKGDLTIPYKYSRVNNFQGGLAFVEKTHHPKDSLDSMYSELLIVHKNGKEFPLKQKYDNRGFREGICVIGTDYAYGCKGKWGFSDSLGQEITALKYDQVYDFSEGRAAVNIGATECEGGKWGFIDKSGKEVIPLIYDCVGMIDGGYDLFGFQLGRAKVCLNNEVFYIDQNGNKLDSKELEQNGEQLSTYFENGKYGLMNSSGILVLKPTYDDISEFKEDLALVRLNNKIGFINKKGELVIPIQYENGTEFSEGLASVSSLVDKNSILYGYIDKSNNLIIDFQYEDASPFENGFARVKSGEKWGVIDKLGKQIIPFQYDELNNFYNGFAAVNLGGKWGYINSNGKEIIAPKYEIPSYKIDRFQHGCVLVDQQKWIISDSLGGEKEIKPEKNKLISRINDEDGFVRFKTQKHGKIGLMDKCGKEILSPKYIFIDYFYEGLAKVETEFGQGYIDEKGEEIIPCIYQMSANFWEGKAKVKLYDRFFYIDKSGKEIK